MTAAPGSPTGPCRIEFIHLTEGVIAHEELAPLEPARYAEVVSASESAAELVLTLHGGRHARLWLDLVSDDRIELRLEADGDPLRLGLEWDRRSDERLVGLGARHGTDFDQGGRRIQLGADRRYTGPECPPEMLADGGIPQGDYAPMPWCNSSRGYGAWIRTDANGTQFDLSGSRIALSTRAAAGPLRVTLFCARTPAAGCERSAAPPGYRHCCPNGDTASGRAGTSMSARRT